jgi:hypothetical protein
VSCRDLAIMISPTDPDRCCDEQRNAPEWWTRCEEQGRRLRERPHADCVNAPPRIPELPTHPEAGGVSAENCVAVLATSALRLSPASRSCTVSPPSTQSSSALRCDCAGWSWERLGLNETFGLMPFEVHAPGEQLRQCTLITVTPHQQPAARG